MTEKKEKKERKETRSAKASKAIGLRVERARRKSKFDIFRAIHPGDGVEWSPVRAALEFADKIETRNARDETPLLFACRQGNLVAALWLVSRGADANARDKRGRTSLMLLARLPASTPRLRRLVVELLRAGADWDARDDRGASALSSASGVEHPVAAALLKLEFQLRTRFRRHVVLVEELRRKNDKKKEEGDEKAD